MYKKRMLLIMALSMVFSGCASYDKKNNRSTIYEGSYADKKAVEKRAESSIGLSKAVKTGHIEPSQTVGGQKAEMQESETPEMLKAKLFQGEIPAGFNREKMKELFNDPYITYLSDTEIMEMWFYEKFSVGFNKQGDVIKFFVDPEEQQKFLEQYIDTVDKKGSGQVK